MQRAAIVRVPDDVLAASFARVPFTRAALHAALIELGPKFLKSRDMRDAWTASNPTRNTCYVVSEMVFFFCAPEGTTPMALEVPGDQNKHRFLRYPDGSNVDLACDQFERYELLDYTKAKRSPFMQTGCTGPSARARQLADALGLTSKPQREDVQHTGLRVVLPELLPPPVVEKHGRLLVVRDDLLKLGSKVRFLDPLIESRPEVNAWAYSCPATGWGQVSLAYVCAMHGKEAHLFMAKRAQPNALQLRALDLGATLHWIDNGMLTVTEARARQYVEGRADRAVLPIGLDHELVVQQIANVARSLDVQPTEIWSVGSSCTLSRGLQLAWPEIPAHVVTVGHEPTEAQRGRAKVWRYPGAFDAPANPRDLPPFPSVATYDAKAWTFVSAYAKRGALFWNVAADLAELKE
jgi:hypothetical protein